jgi:hypothetical protein|tara:strand:+ start:5284 stop:5493 length:210 start_codon:yes stop_codon:yes gene_type:complete
MTLEEDIKEIKQILSEIRDNNAEANKHLVATSLVNVKTNQEIADSLRIFREFVLEVTPEQAKKEIKDSE